MVTVYRYHNQEKEGFDWYKYLEDLVGREITISYTIYSEGPAMVITNIECHDCDE